MNQATEKILDDFSNRIMDTIHAPFTNIYVDLDVLHDFRIGALLSAIKTKSEFDYIKHMLPKYDSSYDKSIQKHFPALKFSDEYIDRLMADPLNADKIIRVAPPTTYYGVLQQVIQNLIKHSEMFGHTPVFQITFNSALIRYTEELKQQLSVPYMSIKNGDFSIDYSEVQLRNRSAEFLHHYDVFLIDDIRELVIPDSPMQKAFLNENIIHKEMFAPKRYDPKLTNPEDEDFNQVMLMTERWLGLAINFQFVDKQIRIYQPKR